MDSIEQGTEAWLEARRGKVTASRMVDVMSKGRGSAPSITRQKYLVQLALERITETVADGYTNAAMQWGTDNEPQARAMYEFVKDVEVQQVGFVLHDHIEGTGASPDGLVAHDGMLEIKCPESHTHWGTLKGDPIAPRYIDQMQWQMECAGRAWCDFVSFDPRFPAEQQLHIQRVHADPKRQAELRAGVEAFLSDLEGELQAVLGQKAAA
jgi:putative phage-type endonuclease